MVLFASKQLFCCGRIRRTRRRAYEKPYYLHAVQFDGDGASESRSNDKGNCGVGNGSKGGENDFEKKTKEGKGKDGCDNDGYDSDGKQKRSNEVGQFLLHFPFINQMKTSELEVESSTSDQRTNVVLLGKTLTWSACFHPEEYMGTTWDILVNGVLFHLKILILLVTSHSRDTRRH